MKNKAIIIAVVVILLLGGGYFYFKSSKTSSLPLPGAGNQVTSGMKSLKDLIAAGIPQKCTFAEGTTYVAGGKVRGDFTSNVSGKAVISHMISDGKTSYIWTEGDKNGVKMTVSETTGSAAPAAPGTETSTSGAADLNSQANYTCSAWLPDNSLFTPPTSVTFTDFSQMFKASAPPAAAPPANIPQIPSGY